MPEDKKHNTVDVDYALIVTMIKDMTVVHSPIASKMLLDSLRTWILGEMKKTRDTLFEGKV